MVKRPTTGKLEREMAKHERRLIAGELAEHDGTIGPTAEALGVSRRTLEVKMDFHGLRDEASKLRERAGIRGPR